jgi:oligopeptide/dipeptide ABC transporter ATP-binding protein
MTIQESTVTTETVRTRGLTIRDISISIASASGHTEVVSSASLRVRPGEIVGLVGESGSGKTLSSLAVLGILPPVARVTGGSIELDDTNLLNLSWRARREINGQRIGMVFQESRRSLDPMKRIGAQVAAVVRAHRDVSKAEAAAIAVSMLDEVGIPDAEARARDYPSQLSGGLAQRAMIALALVCEPDILIADEPTTALDTTVQARILALLSELRTKRQLGILLITHDIGVVAEVCDRVVVMYAGEVVESGATRELLRQPRHPYLAALLATAAYPAKGTGPLKSIPGRVPPPGRWPTGCRFRTRCEFAVESLCASDSRLALEHIEKERTVRCVRNHDLHQSGALDGRA